MVKGKCAIELYMGKKYIFPYNFLGEIKEQFQNEIEEYDIYFVLRGHGYQIDYEYSLGSVYAVVVKDLYSKYSYKVEFNIKNSFNVPNMLYMKTEFLSHFQPQYNQKLKNREGNEKLLTYSKIAMVEINPIT